MDNFINQKITQEEQVETFKRILKDNPRNKVCADCNRRNPTWVSLEFGVFICMNCSGMILSFRLLARAYYSRLSSLNWTTYHQSTLDETR